MSQRVATYNKFSDSSKAPGDVRDDCESNQQRWEIWENHPKVEPIMKARTMKSRTRPASDIKDHWRDIVADAKANGEVFVTHYNRPEVVVVSIDRYSKLKADAAANDPLTTLRAEFDRELAYLREPEAGGTLRRLFDATPDELARAANEASLRRKP
jgi:hypothetical protein